MDISSIKLCFIKKNPNYRTKCPINKCPIYIPSNDDIILDPNEIKNKLAIATFHQSKGRERKYVIVLGFDDSYFNYYNRSSDTDICPSTLYVALTRAKRELHLLSHFNTKQPYNFNEFKLENVIFQVVIIFGNDEYIEKVTNIYKN